MKLYIILLAVFFLAGCTVTAYREGNNLTLKGFGAKSASWEESGDKFSISKGEPFKVPDILPLQ